MSNTAERKNYKFWRKKSTGLSNKEVTGGFNVSIFSEVGAECGLQQVKEWAVKTVN